MAYVFSPDYKLNRKCELINKETIEADDEELWLRTALQPRIANLEWWRYLKGSE